MTKGVKKIKLTEGTIYFYFPHNNTVVLHPDKPSSFVVSEWHHVPTDADKKSVAWMLQNRERTIILKQWSGGDILNKFSLTKKECGAYRYYLEAGMNGKCDSGTTGLYIGGWCEPKIISSKWTTQHGSENIKNKAGIISYGHIVHLHLETEGLNGNELIIEIYNQQNLKSDKKIHIYTDVFCIEGEVNLQINNTFAWMASVDNIQEDEEFYVKVKDKGTGKYVKDDRGDELHAIYLIVKNKVVTTNVQKPQNNTPLKIGKPEVNLERYEPCKFNKINISETKTENGKTETVTTVVFEHGITKLSGVTYPSEPITRSVYFNFDKWDIRPDAKATLDNILQFLLEHEHSTIKLDAHADDRGSNEYNMELSQKRADAVKKHFIDGKLDGKRIISVGHGETQLAEKGDHLTEAQHQQNRRSDIAFTFSGHDANSIIYEVVAPSMSTKKDLIMVIHEFDTKKCFRDKDKHNKKVKVIDVTAALDDKDPEKEYSVGDSGTVVHPVYSDLSRFNLFPIEYIWPKAIKPNQFWYYINTCRYYSDKKNKTIIVKAYSDIKWTLMFFLNLTNDLSVKWQNMTPNQHKELQKKSGKIGAEARWKQKEASFGFSLKGEWDQKNGNYARNKELKAEYEGKFKKLYDLFSSIGAISEGITSKTKGGVRSIGLKGVPITFAIKPPNLNMKGEWLLERAKVKKKNIEKIGTKIDISFNADPLIGLEMTIDLLGTAVGTIAGVVSGGGGAPGAVELYKVIKDKMNTGVDIGNDEIGAKASMDVYVDLVISSIIKTTIGFSFNTESDAGDTQSKLELTNTLKVELKAGVWAKGEVALVVVKVEGYFELSGKGSASVTFGHGVKYDEKGLYYRPQLGFDGLTVEYVVKGKVGLSSKKKAGGGTIKGDMSDEDIIAQDKYEIVPKFDVIKSLEELFGMEANIPLIRN